MTASVKSSGSNRGRPAIYRRTEQLIEVSVFLFLIVPSMVLSFFAVKQGGLAAPVVMHLLQDFAGIIIPAIAE